MLWQLPMAGTIVVNIVGWVVIHVGLAWALTQIGVARFNPWGWLFHPRAFERGGRLYADLLGVHRWKKLLPDGAALFRRGFRKKRFTSRRPEYLERFARETCRGELVHWLVMAMAPLFFLWNEPVVGLLMILYAAVASVPFIVVQRYNRARLLSLLGARRVQSRPATVSGAPHTGQHHLIPDS